MKTTHIDGSADYSYFTVGDFRRLVAAMGQIDPDTVVLVRTDWESTDEHEQPTHGLVEYSEHGLEDGQGVVWLDLTVNE